MLNLNYSEYTSSKWFRLYNLNTEKLFHNRLIFTKTETLQFEKNCN